MLFDSNTGYNTSLMLSHYRTRDTANQPFFTRVLNRQETNKKKKQGKKNNYSKTEYYYFIVCNFIVCYSTVCYFVGRCVVRTWLGQSWSVGQSSDALSCRQGFSSLVDKTTSWNANLHTSYTKIKQDKKKKKTSTPQQTKIK